MGAPRRLAKWLLAKVASMAMGRSRDWASAMLHELDFIGSDWAALFWALGSATVILRQAVRMWSEGLKRKMEQEAGMSSTGKKALQVTFGLICSLGLAGCAFAGLHVIDLLSPGLNLDHSGWMRWLIVIVIPEVIFVAAAILLWRKRGPVAAGILTTALMIGVHVAVHLAMR